MRRPTGKLVRYAERIEVLEAKLDEIKRLQREIGDEIESLCGAEIERLHRELPPETADIRSIAFRRATGRAVLQSIDTPPLRLLINKLMWDIGVRPDECER